jgi:hypothetical protein
MKLKTLCIVLMILLVILLIAIIYKKRSIDSYTENFQTNWTTNKDELKSKTSSLNDNQKTEIKNMIDSVAQTKLKDLITSQSPLLVGPEGHQGPQGPAGSTYIATGRLVNKGGSFDDINDKNNYFIPKYAVSRTEGSNPNSSLSFMDDVSPFASFQNWELDINNHLKNRYDDSCLTINSDKNNEKLYMDKCDSTKNEQKWMWDKTNRLISTTASTQNKLKCIGLSNPETNITITSIPGCKGKDCNMSNKSRKYLSLKDCDINNTKDDETWAFI